ncbi:carboxypeptidase regulatory-like domain-containing protein [Sphingomonas sp.]|uniref:TonB-dependent receptor n=1 Tax=Sphingomonas sp. TaxID=28214 RepID=UPI0035BBC262
MMIFTNPRQRMLRTTTALQALALLGAGVGATTMIAAPAAAQDFQNVTASGRVQRADGGAVAGATVEVRSNAQGFSRRATTGADGSYRIPQLPIGSYTFTITADGYQAFTDANVSLSQSASGNAFTLAPVADASAPASDTSAGGDIVVTGSRTQVADFEQTTTGGVINVSDISNRVPTGRTLNSIVQLTPGTARGDSAFGDLPSVGGASVGENQYFINGLNVTNFRTLLGANRVPFEFYDTVEVKDGGYPAEFGRSTGGFVNATTKSGSNTFHAGTIVSYQPNSFYSKAKNTLTNDNDNDSDYNLQSDFYLSGPIIKDHLFFYGLYESRDVRTGDGGTNARNPTYLTTRTTSPFFAGKVDAIITDGQRLEFTYFRTKGTENDRTFNYNSDTNQLGDFISSDRLGFGGDNFVARYTGSFTSWFTLSGAYGQSRDRDNTISSIPNIAYVEDDRGDPFLVPGSNPTQVINTNKDKREFYRADADVYVNLLGRHHFRFGYDRENLTTTGDTRYTGGYGYQIFGADSDLCITGVDCVQARKFETGGTFHIKNEAFYLQDSWTLFADRLTLQLGVRNDRFQNNNIDDVTFYKSGNQWGPRLGATFDPIGDGRTKVYGSFSRLFLPIAANTNIRLGGAEYDVNSYYEFNGLGANGQPILGAPLLGVGDCLRPDPLYGAVDNCTVTSNGTTKETASTVASNLKSQSADEYILGFERRIGSRITVGVYGTISKLNRALEDSAVDGAARVYCASKGFTARACAKIYYGFAQYVLNNPGSDITTQLTLPDGTTPTVTLTNLGYPKAKREYRAITAKFDRTFDGTWSLAGSYTFSKTVGNYEGSVTSDNGQTDAGLTQDFDQPELTLGSYGYLPNDRRHNFKLYGSYQVFDWLNFGANVDVQSPRSFGCFGWLPRNFSPLGNTINAAYGAASRYCPLANGEIAAANPIVQVRRGTGFKTDWSKTIDLTAAITLPTSVGFTGLVRFDVFNVFNSKSVSDANEFGTNDDGSVRSDYRAPTGYQAPRSARVQFQLRF